MNAPLPWQEIARIGGFTTAEVGRLVGAPAAEVSSWLRGKKPLIQRDYEPLQGRLVLSFDALIEARAISFLLRENLLKKELRRIMAEFRARTGERHPLAHDRQFVTNGFRLFEKDGDRLVNMVNGVFADPTIMKPSLKGRVVFEQDRASFLQPDPATIPLVRIDPRHAFGKPVVVDGGHVVTTSALAAAVELEGLNEAAEWYGVSPSAARQAVEFEKRLAA